MNHSETITAVKWFEDAYADAQVAVLVIDDEGVAITANERACELLGIARLDNVCAIEMANGAQFGELMRCVHSTGTALHTWRGKFRPDDSHHLEVQLTRLPGPKEVILCQLQPIQQPNHRIQAQLIAELTEDPQNQADLDNAGQALVTTVHNHLNTAVVGQWYESGQRVARWEAGDPKYYENLSDAADPMAQAAGDSLSCYRDDDFNAAILTFEIAQGSQIAVSIHTSDELPEIAPHSPFWSCLAATAKTALQSARLLELNRQERLRLRAVLENMPLAVMLFDVDGKVLDLNLRARAMAGRRSWKQIGDENYPFAVCDAKGNPLPRQDWPLIRAVERGLCCEEKEYVIDFGEQQRNISMTVLPITDKHNRVSSYLATARDVTQRSEEEQLKDDFLSVASHELRNPLTPLAGFIQLSRQQAETGRTVDASVLRRAEHQVHRLQRLIDSLLDHTRLETGKLPVHRTPVDMAKLVRRIMRPWLNGPHRKRIEVSVPAESVMAHVDPQRIDQVLTNVVDNAIKHGREDGTVHVNLSPGSDEIVLTVEDEGDGIPSEIIDRVFERYFHVRSGESLGTGLGLYISRQIVEDHGGEIAIDSGRNQGTTVTIRLPIDEA